MSAQIIDGKQVSDFLKEKIRINVQKLINEKNIHPKLCVIIVGNDPASKVYVKNKKTSCEKAGILSEVIELKETADEAELVETIEKLNNDKTVHGILVQLPLPKHINEEKIINLINPLKDVDCFHPFNVGKLLIGNPLFKPCTPAGIVELLKYYKINTSGKNVVIIGRSNIVGKPLAALLIQKGDFADATVTICHSRTKNISDYTKKADILIAAIGKPEFVKGNMVQKGTVVIDVGINRVDDPSKEKGFRLTGDVSFDEVKEIASYITPVPGGVGPMTIAILLQNTLTAAELVY